MPPFVWLAKRDVNPANKFRQNASYSVTILVCLIAMLILQVHPDAVQGKTELDAVVAYLQQLGTAMKGQR